MGNVGRIPQFSNFSTHWRWMVSFQAGPVLYWHKGRYEHSSEETDLCPFRELNHEYQILQVSAWSL